MMKKTAYRGQASLELAFSLICLMVLFWGTFNIFLWLNKQMINRQEDYSSTRREIGDSWKIYQVKAPWPWGKVFVGQLQPGAEPKPVEESNAERYPKLNVFK